MEPSAELLTDIFRRLNSLGLEYIVGGSFASSVHGLKRATNDLDICLIAGVSDANRIVATFEDTYMVSLQEIENAASGSGDYRSFQLLETSSMFKIDVFLKPPSQFSDSEFSRAIPVEIAPNVTAKFCAAEDIILRKLLWFVLGNMVSDRQWNDIVGVLEVQQGRLDERYLDDWAEKLDVKQLLDKARQQIIEVD